MKIGLGTAQLGSEYGVSNRFGPPDVDETRAILRRAHQVGIRTVDTAPVYGRAEARLGELAPRPNRFRIVTKLAPRGRRRGPVRGCVTTSLERLGTDAVAALLLHDASELLAPDGEALFAELVALREQGCVHKLGVSVYERAVLERVLERFPIELVQVPVSVFDQRLVADGTLRELHARGIEVHARSVFLQGALLLEPEDLPAGLAELADPLLRLRRALVELERSPLEAALGFALGLEDVDVVVCGVARQRELDELVVASRKPIDPMLLEDFALRDERLLDPSRWRVGR